MNQSQKNKVTEAVIEYIADTSGDNSQNKLSKLSGVAPIILMAIRDGRESYRTSKDSNKDIAIDDQYYYKVAEALGLKFEREVHFSNSNYARVHQLCRYAQAKHRRGIIDSKDSGAGKTYALEAYARENRNVLYIKATSLMKGKDLVEKIISSLHIRPESKSLMHRLDAIARKVIQPGYLIIIDEMESVSPDMWRVIKDIEDATYGKCGLIISGMGILRELELAAAKGKKLMPQILRRLRSNKLILKALSKKDIEEACKEHDITDRKVTNLLARHVFDWAMLNEYVKDIHDVLISKGKEVSEDYVKQLFQLEEWAI
jgi:polyhydroxyalkanoate synthesis regulator phasin